MILDMCVPCLFGLEGPLGNELRHMGLSDVRAENGRVRFRGTDADMARCNIRSRFGERVLIEMGQFDAHTFDELFEGVKALSWESFIPEHGAFPVKGYSLDSELHSVPDCQKIIKKAVSVRLSRVYGKTWLPEDGELYQIQFSLMKDRAVMYLDTSGTGLHKRGYRPAQVAAPLRETLAAAMVDISGYRGKGDFCDPFCGSGTIAIEAALAAKGRAPGIKRSFSAEKWQCIEKTVWREARQEAIDREFHGEYRIIASDIDPKAVAMAKQNANRAGVLELIDFRVSDAAKFSLNTDRGVIVTNPPYGERMLEKSEARKLIQDYGTVVRKTKGWQSYIISSDEEFERFYGIRATKVRKLYNGMIKCGLYIYK